MTDDSRMNRDFFLQYMRMENPEYDLFTCQELVDSVKEAPKRERKDGVANFKYSCDTQEHSGVASVYLGVEKGVLHLWETGSVINWTCRKDGWPTKQCSKQALVCMFRATCEWNKALDGRVRFKYVSRLVDAAFEVRYQRSWRRKLLATAFFPCDYQRDLNFLKIYRGSFDPELNERFPLFNTLLHELGHVLGLRHEFAHEKEKGAESILFGVRNPQSVMAYRPWLEIQPSDVESIRKAYDELHHGDEISAEGPFGTVTKRIIRVKPNN